MKLLTLFLSLILVFTVFAKNNDHGKGNKVTKFKPTINIIPDIASDYVVKAGEKAQFKGTICLMKQHPVKQDKPRCQKLEEDSQFAKYKVKFHYPDTNQEVTANVSITSDENGIHYNYLTDEINPSDLNRLSVVVVKENTNIDSLLHIQAKIDRFIALIAKHPDAGKSLEALNKVLLKLKDKLNDRLQSDPSLLSRLDYPVQVDNQIAPAVEYQSIVSGMKLAMKLEHGNLISGEKAKITAKVTNIEEKDGVTDYIFDHEDYFKQKWRYRAQFVWMGEVIHETPEKLLSSGDMFSYEYETNKLNPAELNQFEIKVLRSKDVPSHASSYKMLQNQGWGHIAYSLPVVTDIVAPVWSSDSIISEMQYFQNYPVLKYEVSDSFGRIDQDSFSATINGEALTGFTFIPKAENLILQNGSASYEITKNINPLPEGSFTINASIADLSGNYSLPNPNVRQFRIDRTAPELNVFLADSLLTNSPNLSFDVFVVDVSPVSVRIVHNGREQTLLGNSHTVNLILDEGANDVEVISIDAANNSSTIYKNNSIILDTIPPELSDLFPDGQEPIRQLDFNVSAKSNEPLSKVVIDDIETTLDGLSEFSVPSLKQAEGEFVLSISAYDLAGNFTTLNIDYQIILKLIRIDLVSLSVKDNKISIQGHEKAARAGIEIEVDGGFFNSTTVVANADGSFEALLDLSSRYTISAEDSELDRSESYTLTYEADTTFTGVVMDVNDNPLPGVTVTIENSGQSTMTDGNGVFAIMNPATGDQKVIIDGTTIPFEYTNGQKAFSKLAINVSLGNLERNVLDRAIYLAPILLDGTETEVIAGQSVTITSPHAPGVEIDIPADFAHFPAGVEHKINMMEIPVDKISIEPLEYSLPEKVIALEPSGLKFEEPVRLVLPNDNGFPEGTEIVIMSKDSESGFWAPDATATVVGNQIVTKENEGISHFSEIYPTVYGVQLKEYAPSHKPGIFNDKGGLAKAVNLPSYKVMGQDVTPSLIYNSLWANPRTLVTNTISTPTHYIKKKFSKTQGSTFGSVRVSGDTRVWQRPEYLRSQFTSGDIQTPWAYFDVVNAPENSTVSYGVDLGELDAGVYPANASYELRYRSLTVTRTKIRIRSTFSKTKYIREKDEVSELMDAIFPPPLQTSLYLQNKKESEFGRGWKLGINQKILNPEDSKVLIEEASGTLTPYALKNTVETIHEVPATTGAFYFDRDANNVKYSFSENLETRIKESIDKNNSLELHTTPKLNVQIGINQYKNWETPGFFRGGFYGSLTVYTCRFLKYSGKRLVGINKLLGDNGNFIFLGEHQLYSLNVDDSFDRLAGHLGGKKYIDSVSSENGNFKGATHFCNDGFNGQTGCGSKLFDTERIETSRSGRWTPAEECEGANPSLIQNGSNYPAPSFANGTLLQTKFNDPTDIISYGEGTYLIADRGNNAIRLIDINNNSSTVFAGNRKTNDSGVNGNKMDIAIFHPTALAKDSVGNIYFASEKGYIRKIDPNGFVTKIAGLSVSEGGEFVFDGFMSKFAFNNPQGLALDDKNGYLYVADTGNHRIVQLDLIEGRARTIIGTSECNPGDIHDGKAGLNVSICSPRQMDLDSDGNLVFFDKRNNLIRKINLQSATNGVQRYIAGDLNDLSELVRFGDGSFERIYRDGAKDIFSKEGLHIQQIDKVGNASNFSYTDGLLTKAIDAKGGELIIDYSSGRLRSITDPADRITQFTYDGAELARVDYPDGTYEEFFYDSHGQMTSEVNKKGAIITYQFNELNHLAKIIRPDQKNVSIDDALAPTFVAGNYSEDNKKTIADSEDQALADIYKDAEGHETKLAKDASGFVTEITDSKGRVSTIERDLLGRPIKITKFDNSYIEMAYNELGDLVYKFDSTSEEEEGFSYSDDGNLLSYTNTLNKTKTLTYDPELNLLQKETDFNGNSVYRTYYADGLVKSVSNDKSESTFFEHDASGNLIRKVSPKGEEVNYIRDEAGNIITKTNDKQISTHYSYDSFNRLTSVTTGVTSLDPVGKTTSYSYTPTGQLKTIIDPKGNQTIFEYDLMDRLIKKVSPLGQITKLAYDGNNNVIWQKDPNGNEQSFEYDSTNLLVKKTLSDNVYNMTYDDYNNMTFISDSDSSIEFSYEQIGKEFFVKSTTTSGDEMPSSTLTYHHDALGNRTQMDTYWGNFTYSFDAGSRLTSLSNHKGETFTFNFDEVNRLSRVTRPGSVTDFIFDKNSFVTSISHKKSNNDPINFFSYTRDAIGNRTSITSSRGVASMDYDSESQLVSIENSEVSGDYTHEVFSYDSLGNRLNDQLGSFVYEETSQRLVEDYKYVYSFDNNGNMTSRQEKGMTGSFTNYGYSSENQLVKIEIYESNVLIREVRYFYDALGRRMRKEIENHQDSAKSFERKYLYDGQEILAELDENNNELAIFTHSMLRTDDVLAVDIRSTKLANQTGSYFYLKDALGSVVDIVDGSGSIVQHYAYSSFGKLIKISDSSGNDITTNAAVKTSYGFTNREHDEESGMMYYRARYYIPEIGRFTQEDPAKGKLTNPASIIQRFIYVENNPIIYTDSEGRAIDEYGNFCGYNKTGGAKYYSYWKATYNEETGVTNYKYVQEFTYEKDPVDNMDKICRDHDGSLMSNNFGSAAGGVTADMKFIYELSLNPESWKDRNGNYNVENFLKAQIFASAMIIIAPIRLLDRILSLGLGL